MKVKFTLVRFWLTFRFFFYYHLCTTFGSFLPWFFPFRAKVWCGGFHLWDVKLIFADDTFSVLSLVNFLFHCFCKCTNGKMSFVFGQNVRINSAFLCYIIICDEFCCFFFDCFCVEKCVFVLVVKQTPFNTIHKFSFFRESRIYPSYHGLKVIP